MKKIVTHGGTHHADELLAIAVLFSQVGVVPIERTYTPSEDDFADTGVLVLDIGRRFEPKSGNFDHHQDATLPATNLMILRHFFPAGPVRDKLEKFLFSYVDQVDRGEIVEGRDIQAPTFNSIIRACNSLQDGFEVALAIAEATFRAMKNQAEKAVADEMRWASLIKADGVAVDESDDPIAGWHELAEAEGIRFLVTPNKRGGWQIISRDSSRFPIPPNLVQTFRHNSGFLAAYPDKETALLHATEIAR